MSLLNSVQVVAEFSPAVEALLDYDYLAAESDAMIHFRFLLALTASSTFFAMTRFLGECVGFKSTGLYYSLKRTNWLDCIISLVIRSTSSSFEELQH